MESEALQKMLDLGQERQINSSEKLNNDAIDLIALPNNIVIHDLEQYRLGRRRFRGTFNTTSLTDFVAYVKDNADDVEGGKPSGFIHPDKPLASVFFNLYSNDTGAGHADWVGNLELDKTAAYRALLAIDGKPLTQRALADWLEDWQDQVAAFGNSGEQIRIAQAVAAVLKIDIKSGKQSSHADGDFRQARSAMEQVEASIGETTPTSFVFGCAPYHGLMNRDFRLRVSILTSHDDPRLVLRIMHKEAIEEDIVREFKSLLIEKIGDLAKLTIGTFKP